jgi:hypothetical protein
MRCCPPAHLLAEAIRRESEPEGAADPLFRHVGMDPDAAG